MAAATVNLPEEYPDYPREERHCKVVNHPLQPQHFVARLNFFGEFPRSCGPRMRTAMSCKQKLVLISHGMIVGKSLNGNDLSLM